jgi:periplasmic divalent cation tolerance protein
MFVQVTTTTDSREKALALARSTVEARLAACAQVSGPILSVYRWQGAVEEAQEWVVTLKTRSERYQMLEDHIRERHSYDVPEVLATPVTAGSAAYLSWIEENVS